MNSLPIPTRRNMVLLVSVTVINILLLYIASHGTWWIMILAALAFSLTNNTMFSLLHESVHGTLAKNVTLNRLAGCVAACWFPTGWSVQQAFHLTHHRHNRSVTEQFDVLHPEDIRWLKYAQWYSIFTGIYWLITVVGVVLYALTPRRLRYCIVDIFGNQGNVQTSAESYIGILDSLPNAVARLEVLMAVFWHILLFFTIDLSLAGWLCCYGGFALMWSSLQYTDHAFSPLDRETGAWNLRVPTWLRRAFLNYHLHLAHHQNPQVPWLYLPDYATDGPRFSQVWLACWRGPRPLSAFPKFHQEPSV